MSKTLRELRLEKGLTLGEVASALGCAVSGPGSWERGRYGPSPRQIPRLATVLGITAEEARKAAESSRRRKMPVRRRRSRRAERAERAECSAAGGAESGNGRNL